MGPFREIHDIKGFDEHDIILIAGNAQVTAIASWGLIFGLRRQTVIVVGIGGGIGPRGRPLYVKGALGLGGRALRAVK